MKSSRHSSDPESLARPPRALTATGEAHQIAMELREMFCLLDTGELLVANGLLMDQHVLAFRDGLKRRGVNVTVRACSLSELRDHYARSPSPIGKVAVMDRRQESATQQRVLEIFAGAVREGASDIHWFDEDDSCRIRIRVNGLLEDFAALPEVPTQLGGEFRAAIYQGMCDIADSTFKPSQPQDARMKESVVKAIGLYGARVATRPLDKGQVMVTRLLHRKIGEHWTLEKLGYLKEQVRLISSMTQNKHGLHIFAGPTGSGKSTSLEVLITRLVGNFNNQINVITLENPPEYKIAGARQTPVIDDDWTGGIKNAMRLDPDVIMVGEVRDFSSAQAAFQAALTGHGVWTTLHANDPFAILQRLDDLKLDPGLYADASLVRGLIYQCLVPVLCDHCRIPLCDIVDSLTPETVTRIATYCGDTGIFFRNSEGCEHCRKGLKGRSVIGEVVSPTQDLLDMFRREGKAAARACWIAQHGGITRAVHLARLIRQGLTDPILGEAIVGRLDHDDVLTGRAA